MGIFVVLLLCVMLYLYCVAPRMRKKPDRTDFMGVHYAHRGLFDNELDAPENSLTAIQKAVDAGYGIEFDVQLSKDDVPMVFHDASLSRMCGMDGKIWDYTAEELQRMTLANSSQTMPTLRQVLQVVDGKVPLIIEYKMDRVDTKVCEQGNKVLQSYKGAYCVESFHPFAVKWYREHRPDIMRGQLSQDFSRTDYRGAQYFAMTHLLLNFLTRPDFIAYNHKDSGNFSRNICKLLGALSVAWTIKSRQEYEESETDFDLFIFDSFVL